MPVPRQLLGNLIHRLSQLLLVDDPRSFRGRAFGRAVSALDELPPDLEAPDPVLTAVEGIGAGMVRVIREFQATGAVPELDSFLARYPRDAVGLMRLPRMTSARLRSLKADLGVDSLDDLLLAIATGAAETLDGVGPATVEGWERVATMPPGPRARPAHDAAVIAGELAAHIDRHVAGSVTVAGQVRRVVEWVDRIDLVVITEELDPTAEFVATTALAADGRRHGRTVRLQLHEPMEVAVHLGEPAEAGSLLIEATGPPEHVACVLVSDSRAATEGEVYAAARIPWTPPPARAGEPVDAGRLIAVDDLRGDLHLHTTASPDGHMPVESLLEALTDRYDYVAITDHTLGLRFGALDGEGLRRQRELIERLRPRFAPLTILHGAEINIDRTGAPDVDEDTLARLDFVVAGCHSDFGLDRRTQTARIVAAIHHPAVRVLAHPTGRRIGLRFGFEVDLDEVLAAAADTDTALEINGHRDRLDLSAEMARRAVASGVRLAANSDAHRFHELDNVANAVAVAQRAGAEPASVVNALPLAEFLSWAGRRG